MGKIKIKTYDIATGPLHYDYGFKNSKARLFFDIKMSQIVNITMKPLNMTAIFKDVLSAPLYCYNFNVVVF